jgi:sugar phosphate isomerase/epimerase
MTMRLAISGGELTEGESIMELIDLACSCAVEGVELWYPKNFTESVDLIRTRLADAGLSVAAIASGTELGRENDISSDIKILGEALEAAEALGAPYASTYFGYRSVRDDDLAASSYAAQLRALLASSPTTQTGVLIENESDGFGNDPAGSDPSRRPSGVAALMVAMADHRFGLTLDPTNAFIAGNDPEVFVRETASHARYLHAKNARMIVDLGEATPGWRVFKDHGQYYQTCPFSLGAVEWNQTLQILANHHFSGWITIEPHCDRRLLNSACADTAASLKDIISGLNHPESSPTH